MLGDRSRTVPFCLVVRLLVLRSYHDALLMTLRRPSTSSTWHREASPCNPTKMSMSVSFPVLCPSPNLFPPHSRSYCAVVGVCPGGKRSWLRRVRSSSPFGPTPLDTCVQPAWPDSHDPDPIQQFLYVWNGIATFAPSCTDVVGQLWPFVVRAAHTWLRPPLLA